MLNQNQFAQSVVKGMVDLKIAPAVLSVMVDQTAAADLKPGQAVKVVDSAGGIPKVIAVDDPADDTFAVLTYNQKDAAFKKGMTAEAVFSRGSVIYMEASAAIARNAPVSYVVAGEKVKLAAAGEMIIGRALDKAAADGDLIRVIVDLPGVLAV